MIKLTDEEIKFFNQYEKDIEWYMKNNMNLVKTHNHLHVAIKDQKIVYSNKSFLKLLAVMREAGEDTGKWLIVYIHSEPIYYCFNEAIS